MSERLLHRAGRAAEEERVQEPLEERVQEGAQERVQRRVQEGVQGPLEEGVGVRAQEPLEDRVPEPREERAAQDAPQLVRDAELGRGGIAIVRDERDEDLDRHVAKKILTRKDLVDRFRFEARLTARLEHPHIAPVYSYGVDDDGAPWFTMRRISGEPLDKHPLMQINPRERTPNDVQTLLEIFLKVCDATSYAHKQRVIHRDLKPQNVCTGDFGEVYLIDWGSSMHEDGPRDPPGVFFGTLAYAAPEQARGDNDKIDVRTDVFGLGATLYHLLTGEPPYRGKSQREVLLRAQHAYVDPPEAVVGAGVLPRELCRVVMCALAERPSDRYQSVLELRKALDGTWNFRVDHYAAGAEIIREGEVGREAFILRSGRAQVVKTDEHRCTVLRTLEAGDVFGETGAITGLPRTATIRALENVTVAVIDFDDLNRRLALDTWSGKLVRTLADRFRDVDATRTQLQRRLDDAGVVQAALVKLALAKRALPLAALIKELAKELGRGHGEVKGALLASSALTVDLKKKTVNVARKKLLDLERTRPRKR